MPLTDEHSDAQQQIRNVVYAWLNDKFTSGYLKPDNNFLASRSLTGFSTIGLPYFVKLNRDGSPAKYFANTTKTGIQAQCVSLVDKTLKRGPLHGAGILLEIPIDNICFDTYGKRCIFATDAGSQRQFIASYMEPKKVIVTYLSRLGRDVVDPLNNQAFESLQELKDSGPLKKWKYNEIVANIENNMVKAFMINYEAQSNIWFRPQNPDENTETYEQKKQLFQELEFNLLEENNEADLLRIKKYQQLLEKDISQIPIVEFKKAVTTSGNQESEDVQMVHRTDLEIITFEDALIKKFIKKLISNEHKKWDRNKEIVITEAFNLQKAFNDILYSFIHAGPKGTQGELFYTNEKINSYLLQELPTAIIAGIRQAETKGEITAEQAQDSIQAINKTITDLGPYIKVNIEENSGKNIYIQNIIKLRKLLSPKQLKQHTARQDLLTTLQTTNKTLDGSPFNYFLENIIGQEKIDIEFNGDKLVLLFPKYAIDGAWRILDNDVAKQINTKTRPKIMKYDENGTLHDMSYQEGIKVCKKIIDSLNAVRPEHVKRPSSRR